MMLWCWRQRAVADNTAALRRRHQVSHASHTRSTRQNAKAKLKKSLVESVVHLRNLIPDTETGVASVNSQTLPPSGVVANLELGERLGVWGRSPQRGPGQSS